MRIALISAVGRNPYAPVIAKREFDIGHALAHRSATMMIHNIVCHIADNQTERDLNDVERFSCGGTSEAAVGARFIASSAG